MKVLISPSLLVSYFPELFYFLAPPLSTSPSSESFATCSHCRFSASSHFPYHSISVNAPRIQKENFTQFVISFPIRVFSSFTVPCLILSSLLSSCFLSSFLFQQVLVNEQSAGQWSGGEERERES